jgi:methylmalonyl-CoA mutase
MDEETRGTSPLRVRAMFPAVATAAWEAAIARDLKGESLERLTWTPEPGLAIRPFYRQEDLEGLAPQLASAPGEFPFLRGGTTSWEEAQVWTPPPDAVRGDTLHDAGATAAQEAGFAVAAGVDLVAGAVAKGISPADAVARLDFVFAAGSTFFLEIAKLRAARLLWAQASAAFGVEDEHALMRMHVRTSRATKTPEAGITNLLRVTTESLSAVIGGCRSLTVEASGFDPQLAGNVHHIIREESHMDAVRDPAGGSYYIEALTDAVAREAWAIFQDVEKEGGFDAAWQSGIIPAAIEASRARAAEAAASRPRPRERSGGDT